MSKAVKVGDTGTEHDGFPATPVTSGSPDVNFDNMPAARVGDSLAPHSKPKHPPHGRTVASGSSTVFINGKPAAITGGAISCGGVTIGSGTVNIGDKYEPAAFSGLSDTHGAATHSGELNGAAKVVQVPSESAYWPPYDFTKGEEIEVEFTQNIVDLAVMSLEEAYEFSENFWKEQNGKGKLDDFKKVWDGAGNAQDAYTLAKGLGGIGVKAYTRTVNGKEYVIIKGYKKHLKTLTKGNRWRANNPQVVQLGLGTKNYAKNMARKALKVNLVVDITFAVAINAVDAIVHDEKTMVDLVGHSGIYIVKGMIATGVGTVAVIIVGALSASLVAIGGAFAVASFFTSVGLDYFDKSYGISDELIHKLKEECL
ncbi:type VI secretion system PAAR protein [Vibrio sp. JC009]|uniref:type VI secretion system PAAR protein n=1 Tax=Vibrio sp. JC009 TaxID=2912314 RepID=UPI0031843460